MENKTEVLLEQMKKKLIEKDKDLAKKDKEHAKIIAKKDKEHAKIIVKKDKEHAKIIAKKDKEHAKIIAKKDKEHAKIIVKKDKEIGSLEVKLENLSKELAKYKGPHIPPSRDPFKNGKSKGGEGKKDGVVKKPGGKKGHKSSFKDVSNPDEKVEVGLKNCDKCGSDDLVDLKKSIKKPVFELPEIPKVFLTLFILKLYLCNGCNKRVHGWDSRIPNVGWYGPKLTSWILMLNKKGRMPVRLVAEMMKCFGFKVSHSSIVNTYMRCAEMFKETYEKEKNAVLSSDAVNADETFFRIKKLQYYLWIFRSLNNVFFVFDKRRNKQVLQENLGKIFRGILISDGLIAYVQYLIENGNVEGLQRCWAHIIRECKNALQGSEEGEFLYTQLKDLYSELTNHLEHLKTGEKLECVLHNFDCLADREKLKKFFEKELDVIIHQMLSQFDSYQVGNKLLRGSPYWFTCLLKDGVDPTNNSAERSLRAAVILRKIMGALRSVKGGNALAIHLTIMESLSKIKNTTLQENLEKLIIETNHSPTPP